MKIINSVRIGKRGQIVVPSCIRKSLNLYENSILSIYQDGNKIMMVPADKIGTMTRGILKGAWGKNKQEIDKNAKRERESWNRNFKI